MSWYIFLTKAASFLRPVTMLMWLLYVSRWRKWGQRNGPSRSSYRYVDHGVSFTWYAGFDWLKWRIQTITLGCHSQDARVLIGWDDAFKQLYWRAFHVVRGFWLIKITPSNNGQFAGLVWHDVMPFHDWLTHFGWQNISSILITLNFSTFAAIWVYFKTFTWCKGLKILTTPVLYKSEKPLPICRL